MKLLATILFLFASVFAFSQNISVITYEGSVDSLGNYSIIRKVSTNTPEGPQVIFNQTNFMEKNEAVKYLSSLDAMLKTASMQVSNILRAVIEERKK